MSELLDIIELGDPVLRENAKEVENIHDPKIQYLIDDLIFTAKEVNGMGLAAPQVGHSKRIFIMSSYPNQRYPQAPQMEPTAVINPEIIEFSDRRVKGWEGCLSIPGLRAPVNRYKSIKVRYQNIHANTVETEFSDFIARIFQHEYDHLEGIVFLDRLEDNSEIITEKEFYKIALET